MRKPETHKTGVKTLKANKREISTSQNPPWQAKQVRMGLCLQFRTFLFESKKTVRRENNN